jgi:flagellar secretion chaperone FliS
MQPVLTSAPEAQESYHATQIFTTTPETLILMLYDGGIRFINQGLLALEEQNWAQAGWNLVRAQRVVHYLYLCLDNRQGGELTRNLEALYLYINRRLSTGYLERKEDVIREALSLLRTLRDAWNEGVVERPVPAEKTGAGGA